MASSNLELEQLIQLASNGSNAGALIHNAAGRISPASVWVLYFLVCCFSLFPVSWTMYHRLWSNKIRGVEIRSEVFFFVLWGIIATAILLPALKEDFRNRIAFTYIKMYSVVCSIAAGQFFKYNPWYKRGSQDTLRSAILRGALFANIMEAVVWEIYVGNGLVTSPYNYINGIAGFLTAYAGFSTAAVYGVQIVDVGEDRYVRNNVTPLFVLTYTVWNLAFMCTVLPSNTLSFSVTLVSPLVAAWITQLDWLEIRAYCLMFGFLFRESSDLSNIFRWQGYNTLMSSEMRYPLSILSLIMSLFTVYEAIVIWKSKGQRYFRPRWFFLATTAFPIASLRDIDDEHHSKRSSTWMLNMFLEEMKPKQHMMLKNEANPLLGQLDWVKAFGSSYLVDIFSKGSNRKRVLLQRMWIVWRFIVAGLLLAACINSYDGAIWFHYLTSYQSIGFSMYGFAGFFTAVWITRYHLQDRPDRRAYPWYVKATWLLHHVSFMSGIIVTVLFWSLVFSGGSPNVDITVHLGTFLLMSLDFALTSIPWKIFHTVWFLALLTLYFFWSLAHFGLGFRNSLDNGKYIYAPLDWQFPMRALLISIIVFCVSPLISVVFWFISTVPLRRRVPYHHYEDLKDSGPAANSDYTERRGLVSRMSDFSSSFVSLPGLDLLNGTKGESEGLDEPSSSDKGPIESKFVGRLAGIPGTSMDFGVPSNPEITHSYSERLLLQSDGQESPSLSSDGQASPCSSNGRDSIIVS